MTESKRTPVAPLAVVAGGTLLTLGLALAGTAAPGHALRMAVLGGLVAVLVVVGATYVLHRLRLASIKADRAEAHRRRDEAERRHTSRVHGRHQLVAWISDDLRTPLTRLRTTVEALEDGMIQGPDEVAAALETLSGEVRRLDGLVTDLFELTHTPDDDGPGMLSGQAGDRAAPQRRAESEAGPEDLRPQRGTAAGRHLPFDMAFRAGRPAPSELAGSPVERTS